MKSQQITKSSNKNTSNHYIGNGGKGELKIIKILTWSHTLLSQAGNPVSTSWTTNFILLFWNGVHLAWTMPIERLDNRFWMINELDIHTSGDLGRNVRRYKSGSESFAETNLVTGFGFRATFITCIFLLWRRRWWYFFVVFAKSKPFFFIGVAFSSSTTFMVFLFFNDPSSGCVWCAGELSKLISIRVRVCWVRIVRKCL